MAAARNGGYRAQSSVDERQAQLEAQEVECASLAAGWEEKMAAVQDGHRTEVAAAAEERERALQEQSASLAAQWKGQIQVSAYLQAAPL